MSMIRGIAVVLLTLAATANTAHAQSAGAGADYNAIDRAATAKEAERQRLDRVDRPVYKDPLGNALIGGLPTAIVRGGAAALSSVAAGTAIGVARQKLQDRRDRGRR
jgi:hypothetical protein